MHPLLLVCSLHRKTKQRIVAAPYAYGVLLRKQVGYRKGTPCIGLLRKQSKDGTVVIQTSELSTGATWLSLVRVVKF